MPPLTHNMAAISRMTMQIRWCHITLKVMSSAQGSWLHIAADETLVSTHLKSASSEQNERKMWAAVVKARTLPRFTLQHINLLLL